MPTHTSVRSCCQVLCHPSDSGRLGRQGHREREREGVSEWLIGSALSGKVIASKFCTYSYEPFAKPRGKATRRRKKPCRHKQRSVSLICPRTWWQPWHDFEPKRNEKKEKDRVVSNTAESRWLFQNVDWPPRPGRWPWWHGHIAHLVAWSKMAALTVSASGFVARLTFNANKEGRAMALFFIVSHMQLCSHRKSIDLLSQSPSEQSISLVLSLSLFATSFLSQFLFLFLSNDGHHHHHHQHHALLYRQPHDDGQSVTKPRGQEGPE